MGAIAGVGLSTADFAPTLADLGVALDHFERLGIASVELNLANFEVIGGCRIYPDRLAELRRICCDRPFGYTIHGPIASTFADDAHLALQTDACRVCMEVGEALGATAQVHHAALIGPVSAAERSRLLCLERDTLSGLALEAEAANTILCVETLFGGIADWTTSPAELADQIEAVGHPSVRATIDFSHVYINAGKRGFDPLPELTRLAPLARHLHVHDSFGKPQTFRPYNRGEGTLFGIGDLHLPPGRGALPWDGLAKLPFGGPTIANLELTTQHRDQLDAAVAFVKDWVEAANASA